MAKYKSKIKAGGGAKPAPPAPMRGLIPCGLLVLSGIVLLALLFYGLLSSTPTSAPATAPAPSTPAPKP